MYKPLAFLTAAFLLAIPAQAACTPEETLAQAVTGIFGTSRRVEDLTTEDLKLLTPLDWARLYSAAPDPLIEDLQNKDLAVISLNPAAQASFDQRAFRPQVTTPGESSVGVWRRPDFVTPFRVYQVKSYFDGCPTVRLSYNLNQAYEPVRRGKDELRQINDRLVLGLFLQASDLDADGNPIKELNKFTTFWTADLQGAAPWSEANVPTNLGWPWRGDKPALGPCPSPWRPAFKYDTTLYPFTNRCVELSLGTIHYIDELPLRRSKGTILMVHGNPVWSFNYRDIIKSLVADGYRVVAMDYYGFGLSDKPYLANFGYTPHEQAQFFETFVELLDLKNVTVVAQDWGGPIGVSMAGHFPSRIKNFLLMNTWAFNYDNGPGAWGEFNAENSAEIIRTAYIPRNTGETLGLLYGAKNSPEYLNVRNGYWGPFINLATEEALGPKTATPTNIFAIQVDLDRDFLEETNRNLLTFLASKPIYFVYSNSSTDQLNLLAMQERWDPAAIVGTYISPTAGHFIQEWEQDKIVEAVKILNE